MQMPPSFGVRLRWWRVHRGRSQLDLAGAAGTTQRHVSFLESGRSQPSREMVLRLFTTIATLGTPQDVTVQELRIECFFPADADTSQIFRDWAAHGPGEPGSAR